MRELEQYAEILNREAYTMLVIEKDWFGNILKEKFAFKIRVEPPFLEISVQSDYVSSSCGKFPVATFHEGLWKHDVAELFLKTGKTSYLEVNLAPNAAWWVCHFDNYRKRSLSQPESKLIRGFSQEDLFSVNAKLEIKGLGKLAPVGNVCAIIGETKRQFLSFNSPPKGVEPDFHLETLFQPL